MKRRSSRGLTSVRSFERPPGGKRAWPPTASAPPSRGCAGSSVTARPTPPYIFNEHGVGYRIASPGSPMPDPRVAAVGQPPGQR